MDDKKCEDRACIPFFVHENTMMHYNRVNKRMLILFCVWCVTIAVIIGIFVQGNTVREKQRQTAPWPPKSYMNCSLKICWRYWKN